CPMTAQCNSERRQDKSERRLNKSEETSADRRLGNLRFCRLGNGRIRTSPMPLARFPMNN
ncbi:MAG: hypothetical protein ACRC2R_00155, partial [Xenococcaceae cyanobacterium]